jgi:hypothetical protein
MLIPSEGASPHNSFLNLPIGAQALFFRCHGGAVAISLVLNHPDAPIRDKVYQTMGIVRGTGSGSFF